MFYTGISQILSGFIGKLVVPDDDHPDNDDFQLRDCEDDYIEFDQSDISLQEKQAAIATDSNLLNALRVCWEVSSRTYNCGRCKRCTRAIPARRLVESLRRREASINKSRPLILK